jgi:glycosyltransferase EpsD
METHRALADRLSVGKRVKFMGYRDDVPDFYRMADAFVFPSFREGLSVSVMEAMAAGLPVLCSAIRGNTDMIEDGVNGFLSEPGDQASLEAVYRRIASMTTQERNKIGQAAIDTAIHFSEKEVADRYLSDILSHQKNEA